MRRIGQVINKNGYHYEYDQNGKIMYIKNPDGLEMWFDKNENLIKAKWENGYKQIYNNGVATAVNPDIFKSKVSWKYAV